METEGQKGGGSKNNNEEETLCGLTEKKKKNKNNSSHYCCSSRGMDCNGAENNLQLSVIGNELQMPTPAVSTPTKLVPIAKLYSSSSNGEHNSNCNSRAAKARRLILNNNDDIRFKNPIKVYVRKRKKSPRERAAKLSLQAQKLGCKRPRICYESAPGEMDLGENVKLLNGVDNCSVKVKIEYNEVQDSATMNDHVVGNFLGSANAGPAISRQCSSESVCGVASSEATPAFSNGELRQGGNAGGSDYQGSDGRKNRKRRMKYEGIDLEHDRNWTLDEFSGSRFRDNSKARKIFNDRLQERQRRAAAVKVEPADPDHSATTPGKQKWIEVSLDEVDPLVLINCKCKVYWPLEVKWFEGVIDKYDEMLGKHHVTYLDGDEESLCLTEYRVKLFISKHDMQKMNLKNREEELVSKMKKADYDEMAILASTYDDYQGDPGHGDLIWAKVTGYSMWPAFVMDEAHASACGHFEENFREGLIPVQFFGSHDYARVSHRQIVPFSKGFRHNFHLKCQRVAFYQGLAEVQRFLKEHRLPEEMINLQTKLSGTQVDTTNGHNLEQSDADEDCLGDERDEKVKKSVNSLISCPINIGRIIILDLGTIVRDSEHFHDEHNIWPVGYKATRKFTSTKDPDAEADYQMEVLRSADRRLPLFRVLLEDGEKIDGPTPSDCWRKIYARVDKAKIKTANGIKNPSRKKRQYKSGSFMFGFSDRRVAQLLQALPQAKACSKFKDWIDKDTEGSINDVMPAGYRPVNVQWKDLDRCSVCHSEEEYTNNVFLQCDKCRMMVHTNCYGEIGPNDEELWICQLCRLGTPDKWPPCCLCPVTGGAMKKTTDGRWAHLTCATWIPETCLVDVKKMEPIDGLNRINKDRWKLVCCICKVHYGACIQCSDHSCCVSYHPLCARAAGYSVQVLEDDKAGSLHSVDEGEHHLRLLSYCKRHGKSTKEGTPPSQEKPTSSRDCSTFIPPVNLSGCARCEPYNFSERRGRKQPEAAASKRLFVENRPYLVSGCRKQQLGLEHNVLNEKGSLPGSQCVQQYVNKHQSDGTPSSMMDKYQHMRTTFRKRLAFGKSGIHGFGIFAKKEHKAGDMIIEYTGEIVRPKIADTREHFIYNSLVGAGTYMFRIDDDRVIDATRSGSIAHLINHSCEPNCYSRVINVCGDDHIIIFAKRDIQQWEELTYDYRFCSMDEQLACYCGFSRCRGVVNTNDPEEHAGKIRVPRSELEYVKAEDLV